MNHELRAAGTAALSVLALASALAQSRNCDRACLEGMMSAYLTALAAHEPGRLPLTPGVKYAENDQVLPLGTGEWQIAGSPGKYRHVFADPQSGQVAAITTITEHGVGVIYAVRLKVENGRISEIETQISRDALGASRYEKMGQPENVWLEAVPPAQRIPRAALIAQADKYYSGMERNDPKGDYSFFDQDCNRLEHALQTTNVKSKQAYGHSNDTDFASLTCQAQFQTGFLGFVTKIRERRYPVVDEERQAVFAITTFDHNGTVRTLPSVNGKSSPIPPYFDVPRSLHASEAFRLRGEKLFRIEMTLTEVPYGMRSAFHTGPPVNLSGAGGGGGTVPNPCNRACLDSLVRQVLQAMLAHDASRLPLAQGVRYSENGQFIAMGDGLWGTASRIAMPGAHEYAASFADPASGTAAYWGVTDERGTPGVLALRITVAGGKITEIEAIDVREESRGPRGGTMTLMRPPLPVEFKAASLGSLDPVFQRPPLETNIPRDLINLYFDGLERHVSKGVRFGPACTRRDNAVQSSSSCAAQMDGRGATPNGLYNHTTKVRDRRVLVADAERGVVLAVAMVDNPGTGAASLPAPQLVPGTYMVPQLIKIDSGSISRVEGMVRWMPFGYTSAWAELNR